MDGLKQVTLIKSAKFDFARVNVDGNTLFIGANGAGKTTLLRAILYFYTASSNGLGISSSKKISFSDYYFEYENSYIVYVYKKDDKYVLVTAYKDGSVKFRFTLFNTMPDIKDIFIEENRPIEIANLWLKLKSLGNCSNIVQNGAKYKEILYSKNHKQKEFSLFEAKDYDSFTKTLSNIFINSKVDSEAIKKVIVSSLGIDSSIDLSQVHRHLSRFNSLYEDIKSYESNISYIKKIIQLLEEYEQTKSLLQDDISTLCNSKNKIKNLIQDIDEDLDKLKSQDNEITEKLEYEQTLFSKRKDKLNQSKGAIDSFIKEINSKKLHYEKVDIEKKLDQFDSLALKKENKNAIKNKIEFLTKEYSNIKHNHDIEIKSIENSFISSKNILNNKIFDLKSIQVKQIDRVKEEENLELESLNEVYLSKNLDLKDEEQKILSNIENYKYNLKTLKSLKFEFKDEEKLSQYTSRQNSINNEIDRKNSSISLLDKELSNKNEIYQNRSETLNQEYQKECIDINSKIENIKALLFPQNNTLIDKIYKQSKDTNRYLYYLKDEVLRSDIDIEFKEDSNKIFEIEPYEEIAQNSLDKEQESLKTKLSLIEKKYLKDVEKLDKELKTFENKIYKEKRVLNEEIKTLQIELITLKTKSENLKEKKISDEKSFYDDQKTKKELFDLNIINLEDKLKILKDQQHGLLKDKQNDQKTKKAFFTKQINKIKIQYSPKIVDLEEEIRTLLDKKVLQVKKQDELYHKLLSDKNVDIDELKKLEIELLKLETVIKNIEKFQTIIIEYKKDKYEYIDKLDLKNKELKSIKKDIEVLNFDFKNVLNILKEKQNKIKNSLQLKQKEQDDLKYKLKRSEEFENTTSFQECLNWGIKYVLNDDIEDIIILISRIDNTASRYRGYYGKVQNILGKLNNLFNNSLNINRELDALDTAYGLKEYYETNKIEDTKLLLTENLNQILKSIVDQYNKLLESQGKIETLIKKITKIFQEIKIGVIDTLALRYQKTNNKIIETFSAIKDQNEQNSLSFSQDSLFSTKSDSKELVELLKKLVDLIEYENSTQIDVEDSFILEFRVVENGNDSKFVQSLDMVGSNGTDVLVKSMIYVAMLHIFKQKLTKKELSFQVVLDEVGILSQRYLKELIEFANKKAIMFVNGAPDEKLIGTYKQVSLISKINKISVVKELIVK